MANPNENPRVFAIHTITDRDGQEHIYSSREWDVSTGPAAVIVTARTNVLDATSGPVRDDAVPTGRVWWPATSVWNVETTWHRAEADDEDRLLDEARAGVLHGHS